MAGQTRLKLLLSSSRLRLRWNAPLQRDAAKAIVDRRLLLPPGPGQVPDGEDSGP